MTALCMKRSLLTRRLKPIIVMTSIFLASQLNAADDAATIPTPHPVPTSYAVANLSAATAQVIEPSGASPVHSVSVTNSAGSWSLANGDSVTVNFNLSDLTMTQVALFISTTDTSSCSMTASLASDSTLTLPTEHCQNANGKLVFELPLDVLSKASANSVTLTLKSLASGATFTVQKAVVAPQKLFASAGVLSTSVFAQFGENIIEGTASQAQTPIWTRGYGLKDDLIMLPGPTFYYSPGDLLSVNMENQLNLTGDYAAFEDAITTNLAKNPDEVLANAKDKIRQEVNIPHNLNNTNLHVHGLHVDPDKDDVTIVIVPESEADTVDEYDAPDHNHAFDLNALNEGSVSDQSVKGGNWVYNYRIPTNHMPGTHWYHPHKHGSTAAQLENGMAGSQVIMEPSGMEMFPNAAASWADKYDRVMMMQRVADYGTHKGAGPQPSKNVAMSTVNGLVTPNYLLPKNQVVRWRFVNAAANHKAFTHMWLGKDTGQTDAGGNRIFVSQPIWGAAFDGITASELVEFTAEKPLLMAPGNRADVLIQIPSSASATDTYTLFKYYPTNISIVDSEYYANNPAATDFSSNLVWDCSTTEKTGNCSYSSGQKPLASAFAPATNPYLFAPTGYTTVPSTAAAGTNFAFGENFQGFEQQWTTAPTASAGASTPVAPLLKTKASGSFIGIDFDLATNFPTSAEVGPSGTDPSKGNSKWVPQLDGFGGGAIPAHALLTISVASESAVSPTSLPTNSYLSSISPTGTFSKGKQVSGFNNRIPPYVTPFEDADVLQSRPVVFDKSGASISVTDLSNSSNSINVNQFTLSGRPFALNDMIGNSTDKVNEILSKTVSYSTLKSVSVQDPSGGADDNAGGVSQDSSSQCTKESGSTACLDIKEQLSFVDVKAGGSGNIAWTNGVCSTGNPSDCNIQGTGGKPETLYRWVNPGYYQNMVYTPPPSPNPSSLKGYYSYDASYQDASNNIIAPTWQDMTGLTQPALVNRNASYFSGAGYITGGTNGLPGMPIATTAEEWILVNNSDVGHPFHIHINPFFVEEVGQLSYETFADGTNDQKEWIIRAVSADEGSLPTITSKESKAYSGSSAAVSAVPTNPGVYQADNDISHFVGNWWDTVIIPPHGYVKVRYWINVPKQTDIETVLDNQNRQGIWVYHCHILRHEDRGMMMPVITQKLDQVFPVDAEKKQ